MLNETRESQVVTLDPGDLGSQNQGYLQESP